MTEVAKTGENLPALRAPALDIGPQDVALPRLYIGQYMSQAVKDGFAKAGTFYTSTGPDDPDVSVLDEPLRVHVLDMRRGKSASIDGVLESYAYDDPTAPADAYTTYHYVVALPGADPSVPYKFLLKRTSAGAAKKINFTLQKGAGDGPPWEKAFDITLQERKNTKGEYWVPIVQNVEADADGIEVATALAEFIPSAPQVAEQPGI